MSGVDSPVNAKTPVTTIAARSLELAAALPLATPVVARQRRRAPAVPVQPQAVVALMRAGISRRNP